MKKHSTKSLLAIFLVSFAVSFATVVVWVSASSYMEASILGKQVLTGTSAKKSSAIKPAKIPANIQKLLKTLEKAETKECKTATKLQDDFDESIASSTEEKKLEKEMKNCANSLAKIITQIQKVGKKDKKIIEIVSRGKELIDDIKANNIDDLSGAIKDWGDETTKQVQSIFVAPVSGNIEAPSTSKVSSPSKNTTSTAIQAPLKATPSFSSAPAFTTLTAPPTPTTMTTTEKNSKTVGKPAPIVAPSSDDSEDDEDIEDILKALEEVKPAIVQPAKTSTSTPKTTVSPAQTSTKTTTPTTQNSSTTDLSSMTEAQRQQYFQSMYGNSGSSGSSSSYGNTGDAGRTGGGGQVDTSAFAQADRTAAASYLLNSSNAGWVQNILNTGKADPHYLQALTSNEKTGIEILLHKSVTSLPQP